MGIKTAGETGKYQRKMNLLSRKHTKGAELQLWLNGDANLGKASPRCSALAELCSVQFENQNGTTSSFCSCYHNSWSKKNRIFSTFEVCICTLHFVPPLRILTKLLNVMQEFLLQQKWNILQRNPPKEIGEKKSLVELTKCRSFIPCHLYEVGDKGISINIQKLT